MRSLKTTPEHHAAATVNLKERRRKVPNSQHQINEAVKIYKTYLERCGYGNRVIDVGCGRQYLKQALRPGTEYVGIDAFPAEGYELDTVKMMAEEPMFRTFEAETVVAFAVLDNCLDFNQAIDNMKEVATKNIAILTGINVPVDQYHTFTLQLEDFDQAFEDWVCTHKYEVSKNVYLLNYERR